MMKNNKQQYKWLEAVFKIKLLLIQLYLIHLVQLNIFSNYKPYILNTKIFQLNSIVIRLNQGIVDGLAWDNDCFQCQFSSLCDVSIQQENNLAKLANEQNCAKELTCQPEGFDCDAKVYISFIGTDKNGNDLTSASKRISQFKQFSIGTIVHSAVDVFQKTISQAKNQIFAENEKQNQSSTNQQLQPNESQNCINKTEYIINNNITDLQNFTFPQNINFCNNSSSNGTLLQRILNFISYQN